MRDYLYIFFLFLIINGQLIRNICPQIVLILQYPRWKIFDIDSVVVNGKPITSRGAGTAMDFSLPIIEALNGKDAADKVAKAILF